MKKSERITWLKDTLSGTIHRQVEMEKTVRGLVEKVSAMESTIAILSARQEDTEIRNNRRPKWKRGVGVFSVCSACGETYTREEFLALRQVRRDHVRLLDYRACRDCGSPNAAADTAI